jgi:glyoxylase-like metal-dependent hydrolase (beta-lactamase superfamily II)
VEFDPLSKHNSTLDPELPPNGADFLRIRAGNPGPMTLTGTNTYVVGREPAWVIDPGPDDAGHIDAVRTEGEARGGIAGVLLTHSHADHSAGVERLGAALAWGIVSEGDEFRPAQSDVSHAHDTRSDVDGALGSGANDNASPDGPSGAPFEVIPTPGHAADHVAFAWGDTVFCGDIILGEGSTIVPPAAFGGSLTDYLASLERLREIEASLFAPGHGPWISDPRAKFDEYVAHRTARERKLLGALESGERSREALLDAAWDDVPAPLRRAAAMAMQAHLEKLAAEGRFDPAELAG